MKRIDMTGQRVGRLTILRLATPEERPNTSNTGAYWYCLCDCGNFIVVSREHLRIGHTTSCGCARKEQAKINGQTTIPDLAGQRFGRLVVIKRVAAPAGKTGRAYWLCECDCREQVILSTSDLRRGRNQSCGCGQHKSYGEEKVQALLTQHQIAFEREKQYEYKGHKIRFDFYVKGKYFIEYDGVQHYDENSPWYRPEADKLKDDFCYEYNFPLIRIPYTRYSEMKIQDLLLESSIFIIRRR